MLALVVGGCGGLGQRIPLAVNLDAAPAPAKVTAPLRVTVIPFEDVRSDKTKVGRYQRSEEHTSELQSLAYLVCRLLLEKKKNQELPLAHCVIEHHDHC